MHCETFVPCLVFNHSLSLCSSLCLQTLSISFKYCCISDLNGQFSEANEAEDGLGTLNNQPEKFPAPLGEDGVSLRTQENLKCI